MKTLNALKKFFCWILGSLIKKNQYLGTGWYFEFWCELRLSLSMKENFPACVLQLETYSPTLVHNCIRRKEVE